MSGNNQVIRIFDSVAASSPIHRLDPRIKLCAVGAMVVLTFLFNHPAFLAVIFLSTVVTWGVARISVSAARPMIYSALLMAFGITWVNTFFYVPPEAAGDTAGAPILWEWGPMQVWEEGLMVGLGNGLRLLLPMTVSIIAILTTDPVMMARGLTRLKMPFQFAFMFVSSVRFIPLVAEEAAKIGEAQRVRGAEGPGFGRFKRMKLMLVPMLANSLNRARTMGMAVETKAFGAARWKEFHRDVRFRYADWAALGMIVLVVIGGIYLRSKGIGVYEAKFRQVS